MITKSIERLRELCERLPSKMSALSDEEMSRSSGEGKWSKRQVLGHLIDSAANNHQRFIRVQFEDQPYIRYDQNLWNENNHYNLRTNDEVIALWAAYNLHLVHVLSNIPESRLERLCDTGAEQTYTLEWLIDDYVVHMEHHLRQILEY